MLGVVGDMRSTDIDTLFAVVAATAFFITEMFPGFFIGTEGVEVEVDSMTGSAELAV